ncbi:4-(cytidine 5'-diphospho)-2-C-methyl-D-erythritol kinase [Rhizobium sp. L1K21]|uniref:4-(cytidine 5'-diphospho)-2-C-methyl-D-erythritol kinase n=1 Tax=Rhizobium sp. L1K21 TaxID=2954933 RepID=UPI0020923ACA|nr:4-(cytidine 5'-diphospho)-2-C-methyl-D-erythritol kinase [Rhizobium sp. L1K21]MCO6186926.1 4-(cytidine 5'-diphospho)-2-C-methyl-D-erythritol kinase [Rhizobium sp. L1K21]
MPNDPVGPENAETWCAPAKINLALHVTGRRDDGYHTLESLVTFASKGDAISIGLSTEDRFSVSGRFCAALAAAGGNAEGNLVLKARNLLRAEYERAGFAAPPVHIHLKKDLPVASGIGGGSTDAATALRALQSLWGERISAETLRSLALSLGADVPMCLEGKALVARGIGEIIEPLPTLPAFAMVLGNPLCAVSTPEIFRRLEKRVNAALPALPGICEQSLWLERMLDMRNDLEAPARALVPDIDIVLQLIKRSGAALVRMSGSGATCFGIFKTAQEADNAHAALERARPDWYWLRTDTVGA